MILRLLSRFSYVAVFALLVGGGVGLPFPEEIVQLTAGFLARQGSMLVWPAFAVTFVGILVGDLLLFRLGRTHGAKVFASKHFANHDFLTIAVARHISPLRLPVFASAGAMGVRLRTFLLADGVSSLLSVPLLFGLGYLFAAHLGTVKARLHDAELIGLLLLFGLGGAWSAVRRKRGARLVLERRRPHAA